MGLKILCSGFLVRHPVGGHTWHHLQYLIGLMRLGHQVYFFEDYGWENSCFDPVRNDMTSDPSYGIRYLTGVLKLFGLEDRWCYLAEDGTSHGMSRAELARICREADLYINLSNINWIPELEECNRRILVDTDPVFTQIGGHGLGGPYSRYDALFTYGENVHSPDSEMPTGGAVWFPTRQPVVLDLWRVEEGDPTAPITTVINWTAYGDKEYNGRIYGQKDREFEQFISLPGELGEYMKIACNASPEINQRLLSGGWTLADVREVTRDPWSYQEFLRSSRAEFCVAKHGYVSTGSGWFSDRSSAYLASGRPVVVQDTGFSRFLPCGEGLLPFHDHASAVDAIHSVNENYDAHCRAARSIAEEYFNARDVLTDLIERSFETAAIPTIQIEPSL